MPRLLPHLAAASLGLLDQDATRAGDLDVPIKLAIAQQAEVTTTTVERFLNGKRLPRGDDLDRMVSAIADVAGVDWLEPWREAIRRAESSLEESGVLGKSSDKTTDTS